MSHPPGPPSEDDDPQGDPPVPPPGYPPYQQQPPYQQPGQQPGQTAYPPYQQPGQPTYQPGYGQPGYGQPGYSVPTNGKATAALITGIASVVLAFCCVGALGGIAALLLGIRARSEIRASAGRQGGDGMALAGIITGAAAIVLGVLMLVLVALAVANGGSYQYDDGYTF